MDSSEAEDLLRLHTSGDINEGGNGSRLTALMSLSEDLALGIIRRRELLSAFDELSSPPPSLARSFNRSNWKVSRCVLN